MALRNSYCAATKAHKVHTGGPLPYPRGRREGSDRFSPSAHPPNRLPKGNFPIPPFVLRSQSPTYGPWSQQSSTAAHLSTTSPSPSPFPGHTSVVAIIRASIVDSTRAHSTVVRTGNRFRIQCTRSKDPNKYHGRLLTTDKARRAPKRCLWSWSYLSFHIGGALSSSLTALRALSKPFATRTDTRGNLTGELRSSESV